MIGASTSARSCAFTAPCTGSTAPAARPAATQARAVSQSAVERRPACARTIIQVATTIGDERRPGRGRAERLTLDAQPARAVEQERGGHLAGYEETDGDERAKAREEQDAGRDVDGAADPAPQVRGLCVRQRTEGTERADHRREHEQQARADRELERGRADRAADGTGQLHVGARLERQEAADKEEETGSRGLPCGDHPARDANLTLVELACTVAIYHAGPPPERADARRNRLLILEAAAELIGERGFDQVTIDDIAARAGVAKGQSSTASGTAPA